MSEKKANGEQDSVGAVHKTGRLLESTERDCTDYAEIAVLEFGHLVDTIFVFCCIKKALLVAHRMRTDL